MRAFRIRLATFLASLGLRHTASAVLPSHAWAAGWCQYCRREEITSRLRYHSGCDSSTRIVLSYMMREYDMSRKHRKILVAQLVILLASTAFTVYNLIQLRTVLSVVQLASGQ